MDAKRPRRDLALLTISQVARRLNCSERTVRRLVREGKLMRPRRLDRGSLRWFPRDLAVYLYRLDRGDFDRPPPRRNRKKTPPNGPQE